MEWSTNSDDTDHSVDLRCIKLRFTTVDRRCWSSWLHSGILRMQPHERKVIRLLPKSLLFTAYQCVCSQFLRFDPARPVSISSQARAFSAKVRLAGRHKAQARCRTKSKNSTRLMWQLRPIIWNFCDCEFFHYLSGLSLDKNY